MRHLKAHRKLGRTSEHRHSMLRNLATSLINSREERIVTTLPKAKELRPFVERAGKRRQVRPERGAGVAALRRLFSELGERYKDRPGGYTRILKLGHRDGDAAEIAIIELVGNPREIEAAEAEKKRKAAASKKKASKGGKKAAKSEPAEDTESADQSE
jgi:large subunit ribosomal protein L17